MQNSQCFRRGVVLPLTAEALDGLRKDDITAEADVSVVRIHGQDAFDAIWRSGIFQAINAETGSIIDDYEEWELASEHLGSVEKRTSSFIGNKKNNGVGVFLIELLALVQQGRRLNMPLFFILQSATRGRPPSVRGTRDARVRRSNRSFSRSR